MTRTALAALAVLSLASCRNIEGGPEVSQTRTLEPFTRVRIESAIPAKLSPGKPQVTLNSQEKVVANLLTEVKSGVLIVRLKPNVLVTSFDGTEVLITGEAVVAVEAIQGANLKVTGIDVGPFRAAASGGSRLELIGGTADARFNASGGSTIDADQLVAEIASVDATGGSRLELHVTRSVEGSASGGSQVIVSGGGNAANVSASGGSLVSNAN